VNFRRSVDKGAAATSIASGRSDPVPGEIVRRESALDFSGCNSHGHGSLRLTLWFGVHEA
jgi:hypothetical protein